MSQNKLLTKAALLTAISIIIMRIYGYAIEGAVYLLLFLCGWVYMAGASTAFDLSFADESAYLRAGATLLEQGFPEAQNAPLYALWYKLLEPLSVTRVDLYYLNLKLMTVLPALLLYGLLRRHQIHSTYAVIIALVWMTAAPNLIAHPKVSAFAILILGVGLIAAAGMATVAGKIATMAAFAFAFALATAYVRPEYLLVWALLAAALVYLAARDTNDRKPAVGLLAGSALALMLLGLPFGGRLDIAFGQHLALNWSRWTDYPGDFWTDWQKIETTIFGRPVGPLTALLEQPELISRHIASNLHGLIRQDFGLPLAIHPWNRATATALGVWSLVLLLGMALALLHRKTRQTIQVNIREQSAGLSLGLVLLIPPAAISIAIYPRNHYLQILGFLLTALLAILFLRKSACQETPPAKPSRIPVETYAILLLATFLQKPINTQIQSGYDINPELDFLRALPLSEKTILLEPSGALCLYLEDDCIDPLEYTPDQPLQQYLLENGVNVILLRKSIFANDLIETDPQWHDLVGRPEHYGFTPHSMHPSWRLILVRESALAPLGEAKPAAVAPQSLQ